MQTQSLAWLRFHTGAVSQFRGLSSLVAPSHGHLLDSEWLDMSTPMDGSRYVPWYGLGVSVDAPAHSWAAAGPSSGSGSGPAEEGINWHWWAGVHGNAISTLRAKEAFPDSPDGIEVKTERAESPRNVRYVHNPILSARGPCILDALTHGRAFAVTNTAGACSGGI